MGSLLSRRGDRIGIEAMTADIIPRLLIPGVVDHLAKQSIQGVTRIRACGD